MLKSKEENSFSHGCTVPAPSKREPFNQAFSSKPKKEKGSIVYKNIKKPPSLREVQLVDISKLGLNSKIKKFSYSFICGKGYSPPLRGENSFLSTI